MLRTTTVGFAAVWLAAQGAWAQSRAVRPAPPSAAAQGGIADFAQLSAEHDWPWWRGPSGNGVAPSSPAPIHWTESENIAWQSPLPGRGHSSPIVVGDRVLLTTADETQQVQSVLALDRRTGKLLWKTDVSRGGFLERIHSKNTHASPTLACDGQRLFALFAHHDSVQATALDLSGKRLWQQTVGPFRPRRYEYGYAPSPVLYRGLVIVTIESDSGSTITALEGQTGKPVWRAPRPQSISFSTPAIGHVAGRDQLVISGFDQVASFDPSTGKSLWTAAGTTAATCGTAVWDGELFFASGGYPKSETLAVRGDGSGEVLWRNPQKCYEQSMLAVAGYVYGLTDNGILYCWRGADGAEMWKQRLVGPVSASPVLAGGHIYWANERGTLYVFKPNPDRLELVAENKLGDESFASPAVSRGQMFLRVAKSAAGARQESLYCIGK